jgi:hypothetical protein
MKFKKETLNEFKQDIVSKMLDKATIDLYYELRSNRYERERFANKRICDNCRNSR